MRYFKLTEFACRCGECDSDGSEMSPRLLELLDSLRTICNCPLIITSGYRCPKHPAEAIKSLPGTHSGGVAVDISLSGENALTVLSAALAMGCFTGIGIQQKGTGRFIHLDIAQDHEFGGPRPTIWSY